MPMRGANAATPPAWRQCGNATCVVVAQPMGCVFDVQIPSQANEEFDKRMADTAAMKKRTPSGKKPAPTGKKVRAKETHTREVRVLGEAGVRSGLRYPLDRQKVLRAPAIDRISGGFLAVCLAEIGPVDIGPKVFAADGALGGFFDGWAAFGGHWSTALDPFIDGRRLNAEQPGHRRLTASDFTSLLDSFFLHASNYKAQPYLLSIGIA